MRAVCNANAMIRPFKKLKMKEDTENMDSLDSNSSTSSDSAKKHPVSILQELYVPKGTTPTYDFSQVSGAAHGANFKCEVTIGEMKATGVGQNKKLAKETAAKSMLDKLSGRENHDGKRNYVKMQEKKLDTTKVGNNDSKKTTVYYPRQKKIKLNQDANTKVLVVCFDVELAFGNEVSEIYQIGAIATNEDKILINILPEGNIHWGVVKYAGTYVSTEYDRVTRRKYLWNSKKREELTSVISPFQGIHTYFSCIFCIRIMSFFIAQFSSIVLSK